jgi:hypothetical protein
MNGIEIIILIGVVVAIAAGIGYYMNYMTTYIERDEGRLQQK